MLSPSEFNNAVPKFTNGNYANNPVDPQYIEEPTLQDYNRGVEPLETLPAQWWNWLCNQFTSRFNKINTYVKNIFDEITQLLSLLNISPDGTESAITTGQLKNFFKELYPTYVSDKLELGTTYVPQTRTVNGHALTGNVTVTKSDVGLGSVVNTGDSANVSSGGTTKFTTGGAYNILTSIAPYFSTSTAYSVGALVSYENKFYECTTAHSAGAWNSSHFTERSVAYIFTNYILPSFAPTFSTATAYSVGTFVIYQNRLYKCATAHSAGAWNSSHFALATLNDLATAKADKVPGATNNDIAILDSNGNLKDSGISVADLTGVTDLAPLFSTTTSYAVGEYVIYNENMYRCTVAHTGAWNANDFTQVTVGGELTNKADISDLAVPSDAVLHYSFDDLPDYPDGTADVRLLNNNTYDMQSTDYRFYNNGGTTFSNNNGNVQLVINGSEWWNGVYFNYRYTNNKLIKIKFRITAIDENKEIFLYTNNANSDIFEFNKIGEYEVSFIAITPDSNTVVSLIYRNANSATVIIDQIYIGDGSYSTPVIDNANGQWNSVSQSGIAVQGVSGNGYKGFRNNQIDVGNFNLNNNFSVSIWVNPENNTNGLAGNIFFKGGQFILRNGADWGNYLMLYLYQGTSADARTISPYLLTPNQWTNIIIVKEELYLKAYINGVLVYTSSLTETNVAQGNGSYYINGPSNTRPQSYDDLLVFNRALTEKEVVALYNNKANTPKYYNLNNYKIENANVAEEGGTGKYIESIKQEGGLIVPVEQTIDTAPSSASTKPITSGSMYNFLGGNTSAQSWLGKAFGWALGRNWSRCTGGSSANIKSICYGNGKWVAVGNDIYESTNGITWTPQGFTTQHATFNDVHYANNTWIVCSVSNDNNLGIVYDTGTGWTWAPTTNGKLCNSAYYANGIWVANVENLSTVLWSTNGITWTEGTGTGASSYARCVTYANGVWIRAAYDVSKSTDGKSWTQVNVSSTADIRRVLFADYHGYKYWLAFSHESPGVIYKSSNGSSWSSSTVAPSGTYFNSAYCANGFVVATSTNGLWWSSSNGVFIKCTNIINDSGNVDTYSINYANGIWVAGYSNSVLWSVDGKNWQYGSNKDSTYALENNYDSLCFADGMWVAAGSSYINYSNYSNANLQ